MNKYQTPAGEVSREEMIDYIQKKWVTLDKYKFERIFNLKTLDQTFYQYPVNTQKCNHPTELDQILLSLLCSQCQQSINSYKDLVMDIRWAARLLMHPDTEQITIIQGYIFHSYNRPKLYVDCFSRSKYQQLVDNLFKNHDKINNFTQLVKIDQRYKNTRPTDYLLYEAICQLDFVKIQIPVRHKDCRHVGCYELTSLLTYRKDVHKAGTSNMYLDCKCKCSVKINLKTLEQDLVLDKELLQVIQKSHSHSFKFYFNKENNELIDEYTQQYNKDLYFKQYYETQQAVYYQEKYKKYEKKAFEILYHIYQKDFRDESTAESKKIMEQLKKFEFQVQNLNLEDNFLKELPIEYPVRCLNCDFTKSTDIRTYIGYFLLQQDSNPFKQFKCPLCGYVYQKYYGQIEKQQLKDYIYLGRNLFRRLLEHRGYIHTKQFNYDDETQATRLCKKGIIRQEIQYTNLDCILSGKRLKIPLQIMNCPQGNHIDFEFFYIALQKIDFIFEKGLVCCYCKTCKPLYNINQIFFDEFFSIALQKLENYERESKTTQQVLIIRVNTEQIIINKVPQQIQPSIVVQQSLKYIRQFKVAIIQNRIYTNKAITLNELTKLIKMAVEKESKVCILGECFNSFYQKDHLFKNSENFADENSETLNLISQLSKEFKQLIIGTIPEKDGDVMHHWLFSPISTIQHCNMFQRWTINIEISKDIHLFDIDIPGKITYMESQTFSPGNQYSILDTEYGKFGIGNCSDIRFPEFTQVMRKRGCDFLIYLGTFDTITGPLDWELTLKARAIEGQIYLAGVSGARYGEDKSIYVGWAHSTLVDPAGKLLVLMDVNPKMDIYEVDLDYLEMISKQIPILQQNINDLYE